MSTTLKHVQKQEKRSRNNSNSEEDEELRDNRMNVPLFIRILISGASGVLFGIVIEKGRVFEPQVIRDQMLFQRFAMLKMFLSASAIGMVCFSSLMTMPQTMLKIEHALRNFREPPPHKSALGVAVGAFLLGSGMTVAGACPGTVFIQLGAKVTNAWITILGGLYGAYMYSVTESVLPRNFKLTKSPKLIYLDRYLDIPYAMIAVPISCAMVATVIVFERYSPWYDEINESLVTDGLMRAGAWPPFLAGAIIGTLQIPIILSNEDTLGSSSSYVTVLSKSLSLFGHSGNTYLRRFRNGMENWWQVAYICGAVCGGFLSALASDTLGTVPGVSWYEAFGGGVLLIYGARLAGGCTSGHGLSGMGLLAMMSFVAVPAMFGGGIATAFLMKYFVWI